MTVTERHSPCNYCVSLRSLRYRETVELLIAETPDFISPALWPPNSPESGEYGGLYTVWSVMQEEVYQHWIKDVGELRDCLHGTNLTREWLTWQSVRQWRTRLHACVKAKGGYFEYSLLW